MRDDVKKAFQDHEKWIHSLVKAFGPRLKEYSNQELLIILSKQISDYKLSGNNINSFMAEGICWTLMESRALDEIESPAVANLHVELSKAQMKKAKEGIKPS